MPQPFISYPGLVWGACWQAMNWFIQFMDGGATPARDSASAAETVFRTMLNGVQAVTTWQIASGLTAEARFMEQIEVLPIIIDSDTVTFLNTRASTIAIAAQQVTALIPPIDLQASPTICATGTPAVVDPGLLQWCMTFSGEVPPANAILPDSAQDAARAWADIATAIAVLEGSNTTRAYDAARRMWQASSMVAVKLASLTSGPFGVTIDQFAWTQLVALPTLLTEASVVAAWPSSLINQQCAVIRYALSAVAQTLSLFLLSLRHPQVGTAATASLRNSETLMDLAARTTNDFEDWASIAALNGLEPPYPGPTNNSAVGTTLMLPSTGTPAPPFGTPVPSYATNVLGTDYDFGAINQTIDAQLAQGIMPQWTGDFNLITGYANFRRAIGRRLQTTLGTLIYHTDYGSRIPPEVGTIQSIDEAAKLAVFARSAITIDPRTGSVVSCSATVTPPFLASVSAIIEPVGIGSSPVSINETLSPLP